MGRKGKGYSWHRRKGGRGQPYRQGSGQPHTPRNSEHSQNDGTESDIPGFYYDKTTKRYFKILPDSMSSAGNFVTKEKIKKTQHEKQRCVDCMSLAKSNSASSTSSSKKKVLRITPSNNIADILKNRQLGTITPVVFKAKVKNHGMSTMQMNEKYRNGVPVSLPGLSSDNVGAIQKLEIDSHQSWAIGVWSTKLSFAQRIQLMTIREDEAIGDDEANGRQCQTVIKPHGLESCNSIGRLGSLCWSPMSNFPEFIHIMYTTGCPMGQFDSRVTICNMTAETDRESRVFDFCLGRGAIWSCAWSKPQGRLSVAVETKGHVVDVESRQCWTYNTRNSPALAQIFSLTNPHMLYSGTRSGLILHHDARSPNLSTSDRGMKHSVSVVCLRLLQDENYLLASDYSGQISTWDQRMRKVVMKYSGLANSHYQLPFYLDSTESFVYGTGSDSYCKIWDRRSGRLIKSVAPPLPISSVDSFPISHYSTMWSGFEGSCGLVTAIGNRFFFYS